MFEVANIALNYTSKFWFRRIINCYFRPLFFCFCFNFFNKPTLAINGNEFLRSRFASSFWETRLRKLLSETELLDNSSVSLNVLLSKVVEELLSVTNHLRKTSLRMEVLGVLLHMLSKSVDSIGEYSDLNLGRAGVLLVDLVLSDNGGFGFL